MLTANFLAPSLHPNTLLDLAIPEPSHGEPVVKHLPIRHGVHQAVGTIKQISQSASGQVIVADDAFRLSTLTLEEQEVQPGQNGEEALKAGQAPRIPRIVSQFEVLHKAGDIWTGVVQVQSGTITSLNSGQLSLLASSSMDHDGYEGSAASPLHRSVPSPLLALSSHGKNATEFALAGKEVDVSVWDVERTFGATGGSPNGASGAGGKRKKTELEVGEIWRAKNMPNTSLAIRPPNHHLCLAHLPSNSSHLVSGTKSGTVRRYDTRQRKPTNEWKVAREGGVGALEPGAAEHELFFADRSNFLGCMDLRTGRLLYSYPSQTATPHHLLSVPPPPGADRNWSGLKLGLSSVSSDSTLRLHFTYPILENQKGNVGSGSGKKVAVEGMVGGVGIGQFVFTGWHEVADEVKAKGSRGSKSKKEDESGDEDDEEDSDLDDEEVWDDLAEVVDESDEEEEVPKTKKKSRR